MEWKRDITEPGLYWVFTFSGMSDEKSDIAELDADGALWFVGQEHPVTSSLQNHMIFAGPIDRPELPTDI